MNFKKYSLKIMKQRITLIALVAVTVLLPVSCKTAKPLEAKRTVIAGEVINAGENADGTLKIHLFDPFDRESNPIFVLTKTGWKFHAENYYVFGQDLNLRYGNKFICFYIEPGDSIFIRIDAAKLAEGGPQAGVTFEGERGEISRQVCKVMQDIYAADILPRAKADREMTSDQIIAETRASIARRKEIIDAYATENGFDDLVREWALTNDVFWDINGYEHYLDKKEDGLKFFKDSVFDTPNPRNFRSSMFQTHVNNMRFKILRDNFNRINEIAKNEGTVEMMRYTAGLIKNEIQGVVGDYAVYLYLSDFKDQLPLVYDALIKDGKLFGEQVFVEKFKKLAYPEEKTTEFSDLDDVFYYNANEDKPEKIPSGDLMKYLAGKYAGRVLYVDIWATWCGPCLEETRYYSPALHEHFKDKKDVVFVNLCLSSSSADWGRVVKEMPVRGENYFLNQDCSEIFSGEHKISGYPSYWLVDRNGELVEKHAPRPSESAAVIGAINDLLK